jgi:hypothetical protein
VTLCSVVIGYQRFRGPCCLHLRGEVAGMGKNGIDIGPVWRGAVSREIVTRFRFLLTVIHCWLRAPFLGLMAICLLHQRLFCFCLGASSLTGGRVCHVKCHSLCLCLVCDFLLFNFYFFILFIYLFSENIYTYIIITWAIYKPGQSFWVLCSRLCPIIIVITTAYTPE